VPSFPSTQAHSERRSLKTILLLRHAKSSWDQPHLPDPLRPLAPRGREAAPLIGAYMARNGMVPNRVLCSPARRATETWELVSEQMDESILVEIRDELYHASSSCLLSILRELPDTEKAVLFVGHNPAFEELASVLATSGPVEALAELSRKFPTGALAVFDFSVSTWSEVREGTGSLRDFVRPRTLKY